jgi:hypothetical protein
MVTLRNGDRGSTITDWFFVVEKYLVLCEVRTQFLYIIFMRLVGGSYRGALGARPGPVPVRVVIYDIFNCKWVDTRRQ